MRILFIVYGHVSVAPGGAQQVGAELLQAARSRGHVAEMVVGLEAADAARLARSGNALAPAIRERGLSYFTPSDYDASLIACGDWRATGDLREHIERFRPDVVHFQHYHRIGVEAIVAARLAAPRATISLTFHEMIAMCPANGQMVKVPSGRICEAAVPAECAECVPERPAEFYRFRADRLRAAFDFCDALIFPSRFLRDLYSGWGLPGEKSVVVPNGLAHPQPEVDCSRSSAGVNRFAFFGQLIDHKGVDVVLRALAILVRSQRIPATGVEFHVHGANSHFATPTYLDELEELAQEVTTGSGGLIKVFDRGAYRRDELAGRMAETDWVLVPSVWPENDPLVVLEARMFGRPVIGSAVGGLVERVRHGVDGYTFPVRDASALADRMAEVCGGQANWARLNAAIEPPPTDHDMCKDYEQVWLERRRD